jgi:hypothetical protein
MVSLCWWPVSRYDMAELTIAQWVQKQRKLQEDIRRGLPLEIAARTVHTLRVNRIFHEGRNTAGGSIGAYDRTRELWVPDSRLRRNGSHRGKTGKPIKTTYFKSYFALKSAQGFDAGTVNLRLTNDLQSDFANARLSKGSDNVPTTPPIKVSPALWKEELRRSKNVDKMNGNEKRFGRIFGPTKQEEEQFQKVGYFEMVKILKSAGW